MADDPYAVQAKRSAVCLSCHHKHLIGVPCPCFIFTESIAGRISREMAKHRANAKAKEDEDSETEDSDDSSTLSTDDDDDSDSEEEEVDFKEQMMSMLNKGINKAREAADAATIAAKKASVAAEKQAKKAMKEAKKAAKKAERLAKHKLKEAKGEHTVQLFKTPKWAEKNELKRCNCLDGVDNGDSRVYYPLNLPRFVTSLECPEGIRVRMEDPEFGWAEPQKVMNPAAEVLDFVFQYVGAKELAKVATVDRLWRERIDMQTHFIDMKQLANDYEHQVHSGRVESCLEFNGRLYTAGDKRVKVWNLETYECLAEAVRETAVINDIQVVNGALLVCASNGSIRQWSLTHNPKNIAYVAAYWEHRSWINDFIPSEPEPDDDGEMFCRFLYSVSDDRTVKVWDANKKVCLFSMDPPNRTCGTMRSVARSARHLYVGSSNGVIYVYPLKRECDREDRHGCSISEHGALPFCLQTELQHGKGIILQLECGGYRRQVKHLYSASTDGTFRVWSLPGKSGYEHECLRVIDAHAPGGALSCFCTTWAHLFTAGQDKVIRVWNLHTMELQKVLHPEELCKCMYAAENEVCSYLYTGHVDGKVIMWRLGAYV
eukprot:CAMPEP_0118860450 /NCGR_PEP_ID=MMETSP1163-20130328/6298_1 /TAXON_ID=124430 /ORGANISM="Phaeomonas parva, Strain CCMP2877" /LENGTH=601 /DNA_ID=CAMNT_0006794143 /DNA_START=125 /DNA_END=1930 /DNA_ORIENTATION=-